jgi:hypothetical protein
LPSVPIENFRGRPCRPLLSPCSSSLFLPVDILAGPCSSNLLLPEYISLIMQGKAMEDPPGAGKKRFSRSEEPQLEKKAAKPRRRPRSESGKSLDTYLGVLGKEAVSEPRRCVNWYPRFPSVGLHCCHLCTGWSQYGPPAA